MCMWRAGDGVRVRVKVVHSVTLRCSEPKDNFVGFCVVVMLELSSRALVLLSFARSFFINFGRSLESLLSYQTKAKVLWAHGTSGQDRIGKRGARLASGQGMIGKQEDQGWQKQLLWGTK